MNKSSFIKINPADSVVVCLRELKKGEVIEVDGASIQVRQDTPAGHKILIADKAQGENIIKYGYPIGHAKKDLLAGEWVNENNLKTNLSGTLTYEYHPVDEKLSIADENRTFMGYTTTLDGSDPVMREMTMEFTLDAATDIQVGIRTSNMSRTVGATTA